MVQIVVPMFTSHERIVSTHLHIAAQSIFVYIYIVKFHLDLLTSFAEYGSSLQYTLPLTIPYLAESQGVRSGDVGDQLTDTR